MRAPSRCIASTQHDDAVVISRSHQRHRAMVFPFGLWHRTQRDPSPARAGARIVGEAAGRSRRTARTFDVRGRRRITELDQDLDDVETSGADLP